MSKKTPTLHEILKASLDTGLERTKLAEEAAASAEEEKKKEEDKKKKPPPSKDEEKKGPPTEEVDKTAAALEYVLQNASEVDWDKIAMSPPTGSQSAGVGIGDTALAIEEANTPGQAPGTNQGQAARQPPTSPGIDPTALNAQTTVKTDMGSPAGSGKHMPPLQEGIPEGKQVQASLSARVAAVMKMAEDSGAKISAGPAAPFSGDAAGENKIPVPPLAGRGESLIATNQAAIDATKRQAKQVDTKPVDGLLSEKIQKKSGDKTLHLALDHTDEAGAKISSLKTRLAREWLNKQASIADDATADPTARERAKRVLAATARLSQGGAA